MNAFDALVCLARREWRAARAPGRALIAVSGGADSVGLLRVLHALTREESLSLAVAHVDHGLRDDSADDAAFVQALCEGLKIPCLVARLSLARRDENAAREARYAALYERALALNADVIALAHHEDDQAETVLMHLARGAGGGGLGGMAALKPVTGQPFSLWRPFLTASPEAIRAALREIGQPWREDSTNATDEYFRNRVRRAALPALESGAPGARRHIARAARVLADENEYLNALADAFLDGNASRTPPCFFVMTDALDALPVALKRRAVRLMCGLLGVDVDFAQTERMLALNAGETCNLPLGFHAERSRERLHFLPPHAPPTPPGKLETSPFTGVYGDGRRAQAAPEGALAGAILRHRRPGDVIQPLGMAATKPLQDYLIDQKIDRPFRDHLPLLCRGSEVLWAIGVGASERLRVEKGAAAVFCQYIGRLPTEIKEAAIGYGEHGGDVQGH